MKNHTGKHLAASATLAGIALLAGCAGGITGSASSASTRFRCEGNIDFSVAFVDDTAVLKGTRGDDVLLRDAGGQGGQTVYSNPRLRAEFGLGASGREAVLRYLQPPLVARCVRE